MLYSVQAQNQHSSLHSACTPNSRKLQYSAWNFLLFRVARGLPGVTSSVARVHGCSGEGGCFFSRARKKTVKDEQSLVACHNIARGCAIVTSTSFSSLSNTVMVCKSVPCGVCVAATSSLACLIAFRDRSHPSGSPFFCISFKTAPRAEAVQCGSLLLQSFSFLSLAALSLIWATAHQTCMPKLQKLEPCIHQEAVCCSS